MGFMEVKGQEGWSDNGGDVDRCWVRLLCSGWDGFYRQTTSNLTAKNAIIKLKAMQSWIFDLEEQHAVFLQTMVQLEQEAVDRVSLLQEGLHRSSQAALAYRTKLDDYDKDDFVERGKDAVITDLNDESLRLYLDLDKCKDDKGREVSKMKEEILTLKFDIKQKDEQIQRFERSIEAFHNNIHNKLNEVSIERQSQCGSAVNEQNCDELLRCSLQGLDELFQRAQEEKEEFTAEVTQVKTELKESKAKIEQLAKTVNDMNQSNKDIRESLTAEVAAKHDEIVDLRRMNRSLEERCRETEMMVLLKDDIIKELRKDLKASGFKHVSCSADRKNVVNNSQQEEQSLRNVSRHADNNPNDNQQVQAPDNKPDYQLKQVPASPDEPQHSFSCQYHSTPKKSSMFCSRKKVYDVGNTDETKHQSACDRSLSLEHSNWSYILNATDEWSADGSYHKVCQCSSLSARHQQLSADGKVMSGPKRGTVHLKNFALQVQPRQNHDDSRRARTKKHDHTSYHTCGYPSNLHRRHSSANSLLH
ncbi:hypothetical protein Cfor_11795 [Coptotermes formosanus]|uniref:Uncharacterized protein n=1 Tax=Coptotermes formosanus TaxID=36987 RepID=A0A6L2PCM7_COPFO|nr:hypothetical protein Cfor_11795 [Coptotermes formosanus]